MSKIQIKRGLKSKLPTLNVGELGLCTDTNEVFIGSSSGNVLVNSSISDASKITSGTMSPARIAQNSSNRFVTDSEKSTWNGKAPTGHSSTAATYGLGTNADYGHLKLSNGTGTVEGGMALAYNYKSSAGTVNLNDYRSEGEWTLYSVTTATNFPTGTWTGTGNASHLKVMRIYSDTAIVQILNKRGTTEMWIRYGTSATAWGSWERLATTADLSALPSGGGKKYATKVVGHSGSGYTANDVDYLCDGTDDHVEIQNAINALPSTGGEVLILEGTYNIVDEVTVTKNNVSISGVGNATIFKRMFDQAITLKGLIKVSGCSGCKISNMTIDGNAPNLSGYEGTGNCGILTYCATIITDVFFYNNTRYGVYLTKVLTTEIGSDNSIVSRNVFLGNEYAIVVHSDKCIITENMCCDNNNATIWLRNPASNNLVTGNFVAGSEIGIGSGTGNVVTGNKNVEGI